VQKTSSGPKGLAATTKTSPPTNPPAGRRQKQKCHTQKFLKSWFKPLEIQVRLEELVHEAREVFLWHLSTQLIEAYGFVVDLSLNSPSQDAICVLGETLQRAYFSHQNKLAFHHDLTPRKIIPLLAKEVLGLSFKLVPVPSLTTSSKTIHDTMDRLDRNVDLKVFFAGAPEDPNSQVSAIQNCTASTNGLSPFQVHPTHQNHRLHNFHQAFLRIFQQHCGKANLSCSRRKLLNAIRRDVNILIISADKGLQPCVVTYIQYVSNALKHLRDESTYQRLSEEEAFKESCVAGATSTRMPSHQPSLSSSARNCRRC
jgi:hypothetical protein